jgi:hypothetical protein
MRTKADKKKTESKNQGSTKEWFKDLLSTADTNNLPKFIAIIPEELIEEQAFIMGYSLWLFLITETYLNTQNT